jgi:glyoxylase-like metal-dependent hydrolase (beta-lactamase superfamily II)
MRIGDLEIHLISDGMVHVDAGGPFGLVPQALYARHYQIGSDNTVQMRLTCMVVRSRGKTILIDTGFGTKLSEKELGHWKLWRGDGGLVESLAGVGIAPQDVDMVVNTHLHDDHCGGNTKWEGELAVAVFPNARYYVQRIEWAVASNPNLRTERTYAAENFTPLLKEGRMLLLHGDTQLTDQVQCVVTPGHTRGHQSVLLRSGDWRGMFLGDVASYAVHMMRAAWLTSYDEYPLENLATKQRWQQWALRKKAWLFVEHDPTMPVIQLVRTKKRLQAQPVAKAQALIDELPTLPPLP